MYLFVFIVILLVAIITYYIKYLNVHKQDELRYYREIPSNENPALIGFMVKGNVDGNDVIATLLDLWKKGYINIEYQIENNNQVCVINDNEKDRFLSLKDYENYLLDELFKDSKSIILDDFVSSPKFKIIFKNIGNMISRRVNLKSNHRVSYKRLFNKIVFLVHIMVFGFAIFFPTTYLISHNYTISFIISFLFNAIFICLIKAFVIKEKYDVEHLLFNISFVTAIIYIFILIILFLLNKNLFEMNLFCEVINLIFSLLLITFIFVGDYDKKMRLSLVDYIMIFYVIYSVVFMNTIGLCINVIYFSHRLYLKSPKHISLLDSIEIDKWIALKRFLNDFSLIKEREILEVKIWEDYLIYGIAMGINKKIVLEYANLSNLKLINTSILDKFYSENIMY